MRAKGKKLPPLNALRVFEIAARRLSFTRAAEELNVTTAAVSHQIRLLESHLELKLFERENNVLTLTAHGVHYLPHIRDAFSTIQLATDTLLNGQPDVLRIAVPASFGTKWLVPRLPGFFQQYPDLRLEIVSDVPPSAANADIIVNFHLLRSQETGTAPLIVSDIFPVCSAVLAHDLHVPDDLARFQLLHEENAAAGSDYPDWAAWLSAAHAEGVDPHHGSIFSLALMALEAAIEGQGVALAQRILVEADIAAGRLVRLFDIDVPHRIAYYLSHASSGSSAIGLEEFYQWLQQEAHRMQTLQNQ